MPSLAIVALHFMVVASGCSSTAQAPPTASVRLPLVAVLYGKYVSAQKGEMPASQEDLVAYVDANEKETLQRRGYRSAADIFVGDPRQPEIIVLYRDARERLQTDFVAIEEQTPGLHKKSGQKPSGKSRSKWYAADILGVAREIDDQEAERILTETKATSDEEAEPAVKKESNDAEEKSEG